MPAIFLSYRRDDSRYLVNAIYNWLVEHGVPPEEIFLDTSRISIPTGAAFPDRIGIAAMNAACALVIIGPGWIAHARKGWWRRRSLWRKNDWVRKEIEIALLKPGRALPVLLDQTPMPRADELPPRLT